MPHRDLNTPEDVRDFTHFLGNLKLPLTVEWVQGRDRSKQQNKLQWQWAGEVAEQLGDRTQDDVQAEWKLRHGIPILRADSPEFREVYDRNLKGLPYPNKIEVVRFIDVTSAMKVRQMIQYLDTVERECRSMGLQLTQPDPDLAKYQARYRAKEAA